MLPQPAGSVDLPTRPAPPHRATLATPLVRPNPRRSHTPKPRSHRSRTPAHAAAVEVQVGFFPKASSQDADVATGGVPDDQSGVFKLGPHSNVGLPRPQRSPRVRPCDIVQQALERGILVGNNRRSHERSSVHAAFFDDDLIWETSPGLADQPEELLKPKDSLSKSFKPHSPGRRNRDKQSPSQPPPKDNANLTEVISNKILLKYFSTTLDKVDSPLEIWNVVKKCTDEIAALTGTAPSLRPKTSRNSASKPSDIPYPLAEQRDSGVELTPKDHQSQSPVKGWPEARPRSNSSSYDSGFHSDRKSVSPERQYTAKTEDQDASGVTSRGLGTGGFASHAGEAGSSNPISFSRPRRKRNARETGGDDSSQDEGDSDAGDDRGKPPFDHDRAKHKKTRLTEPESNLSCPFRKRNPLRFNIRDHHPCAGQGFPNMAVLKRHIRTFHKREQALHICVRCQQGFSTPDALTNHLNVPIDEMCASRPVQPGGDPEDGITHKVENSLIERKASSKVDNWEGLWKKLFPFDQDVPEPDFEPPIELDEVYVEFRTVLPRLIYTLQEQTSTALQRHGPHHSLQHVFEPICDNFVEHTFSHCRRSLAKNPRRYMRPKKEQPQQQGEQTANPSHKLAMQQQYAQIAPCPSSSSQSVSPFPPRASRGDHIPTPTSLTQDHYPAVEPISRPKTAFREIPGPIPSSSSLDILGNTVLLSRPDTLQHSMPDDPNLIQTDSAIDLSTIDSRDSQFDDKCGLWSDSNSIFTCSSNSGDHIDLADMNDAFIWDMNTLMR